MDYQKPNNIRFRFAPSPTGFLHIGSLRTALFNYLAAKSMGGQSILRIEDTDKKREVPGAVEGLIGTLNWLGIKFDEGPHLGGAYGPYVQSKRLSAYRRQAELLLEKKEAYRCFCSAERLQKIRDERQAAKLPPRYDRKCRDLTEDRIREMLDSGAPFVIRQKMPLSGDVIAHDELRGDIRFKAGELEDHVLMKSDGVPTYQLAVVVDDRLMEISHVIRGEEWIPSLPKNILLYQSFGWDPPKFIHLALTLNKGGGKLSKRQGDVAVEDYRRKGYLPEALLNFCALLGWHPKDERELLTVSEMVEKFNYLDMGTSPAVFDIEKLDYLNGYHIRQKSRKELAALCVPFLKEHAGLKPELQKSISRAIEDYQSGKSSFLENVIGLEQERLKKLFEAGESAEFFFRDMLEYPWELLVWKSMTDKEVLARLVETIEVLHRIPEENWTDNSIGEALLSHIRAKGGKNGEYLWPMRVALTGRKASPGPFEVAEILGKEKTLARMNNAVSLVRSIGR